MLGKKTLNILSESNPLRKVRIVYSMMKEQSVIDNYQIENDVFSRFIKETERLYNHKNNSFHNFDHGITGSLRLTKFSTAATTSCSQTSAECSSSRM